MNIEKPRLVASASGQGFLHLNTVEYQNRFLYSKYSPDRAVLSLIEKTEILPDSVVVVCSPCLWYGLKELKEKCSNSAIVCIEADEQLYDFSVSQFCEYADKNNFLLKEINSNADIEEDFSDGLPALDFNENAVCRKINYFNLKDLQLLDKWFRKLINTGKFRRVLKLDFSAGVQFGAAQYNAVISGLTEINEKFWKNRLTLQKFGRLYSKNIFRNLKTFKNSCCLKDFEKSVSKPIIVCGAGESMDELFPCDINGKAYNADFFNRNFFIIAVDAALSSLQQRGIKPAAAVLVEAQFAIKKAFLGADLSSVILFKDLCSRPDIVSPYCNCFFFSEFAENNFTSSVKEKLCSSVIPPMGSVGLTAAFIAEKLAAYESVPVIYAGLDFAYSAGNTHGKGTVSSNSQLLKWNGLCSRGNYEAVFGNGCFRFGKYGSSRIMKAYAENLSILVSGIKRPLYNCSSFGLDFNAPRIKAEEVLSIALKSDGNKAVSSVNESITLPSGNLRDAAKKYLQEEKAVLEQAEDLLIHGEKSTFYNETSLQLQVKSLLEKREYLFLHFPDGFSYSTSLNFLKRVRAEIDFFLKQINWSLK